MSDQNKSKCLVCKTDLSGVTGVVCPVCGFMIAEIFGDQKAFIENNKSEIESHRNDFMKTVSIGVKTYNWEIKDGTIILDHSEQEAFGTLYDLYGKTTWLSRNFDSLTGRAELETTIYIKMNSGTYERIITVPNPGESEYYQLGITVDHSFDFRIVLRNQSGKSTESKPQQLF